MQNFEMNHFCNAKYIINIILGTNLLQNFASILIWNMDKRMDNYNKNKNQILIMLIIKFERYNNQCSNK